MRKRLRDWPHPVVIQWVPGHCGIPGNELADQAAKEAAALEGPHAPTHYASICCWINTLNKDQPSKHERTQKVYAAISKEKEMQIQSRSDQTLLAKIRTGKTVLFRAYQNELQWGIDPMCLLRNDAFHTLEHWITECPRNTCQTMRTFQ